MDMSETEKNEQKERGKKMVAVETAAQVADRRAIFEDEENAGLFVAVKSPWDRTVVGKATTAKKAISLGKKAGVARPLIVFVPPKGSHVLY